MAATDIGTGATILFATSSFSAEIESIGHSGISREAVESTHLGTTNAKTFIAPDLYDPGELSLEMNFDPDTFPPIDQPAEVITVTFPTPIGGASGASWAASGFMTEFEYTAPLEEKMTATATVKFSGVITPVASV